MKTRLLGFSSCTDQRRNQFRFAFASWKFRDTLSPVPKSFHQSCVTARSVCQFHRHPSLRSHSFSYLHLRKCIAQLPRHVSARSSLLRYFCSAKYQGMPDQVLDLYPPCVGWVSWRCCQQLLQRHVCALLTICFIFLPCVRDGSFNSEDNQRLLRKTRLREGLGHACTLSPTRWCEMQVSLFLFRARRVSRYVRKRVCVVCEAKGFPPAVPESYRVFDEVLSDLLIHASSFVGPR